MKYKVLLLPLLCLLALGAPAQDSALRVGLKTEREGYLPQEELPLMVTLANVGPQPIHLGGAKDWLHLSVQGEKVKSVPVRADLPLAPVTVAPGSQENRVFNLADYFKLDVVDHYQVTAEVSVPEWEQRVSSAPCKFFIQYGTPMVDVGDLTIGVTPALGASNGPPEMRRFQLLKVTQDPQTMLYCQLIRVKDNAILKVFPLDPMLNIARPEVKIDRLNHLNILYQTDARLFHYSVVDPNGRLMRRRVFDYTDKRPTLRTDPDGFVGVDGGKVHPLPIDPGQANAATNK